MRYRGPEPMLGAVIVALLGEAPQSTLAIERLVEETGKGRGVVISACDELERMGYLRRSEDRRTVALTPRARRAVAESKAEAEREAAELAIAAAAAEREAGVGA